MRTVGTADACDAALHSHWNIGDSAGAESGALGSLTGYCPHRRISADSRDVGLASEFEVRALLRQYATDSRIAVCGARVYGDPVLVTTEYEGGERRAHWTGVILCNRAGCPVCAGIRARRFGERVRRTLGAGGRWLHVTFTVPHRRCDDWSRVYERLLTGVRELTHGQCGRVVMRDLVLATIRATETTWSQRSGWHVHFHCLWHVRRSLLPAERALVSEHWARTTDADLQHGVHFGAEFNCDVDGDRQRAAQYVSKLAAELSGACKVAQSEHWSLGEMFARAAEGDSMFVSLIREYQQATKGRRIYQLDRRAVRLHDAAPELPGPAVVAVWRTCLHREEFGGLARIERRARDRLSVYLPLEVAQRCRGDPSEDVWDTVNSLLQGLDVH